MDCMCVHSVILILSSSQVCDLQFREALDCIRDWSIYLLINICGVCIFVFPLLCCVFFLTSSLSFSKASHTWWWVNKVSPLSFPSLPVTVYWRCWWSVLPSGLGLACRRRPGLWNRMDLSVKPLAFYPFLPSHHPWLFVQLGLHYQCPGRRFLGICSEP